MLKRSIVLLFLLALVFSACSRNTVSEDNPGAERDALVSTKGPTPQTPSATPLQPTDTPRDTATPIPTESPVPTLTPMLSPVGPDNFPPGVNPLTGLQVQDPSILERRPVSIKVQIFPRGQRPPMGISQADIIYDYYQNTGMTRFHTIFYGDNSTQVGPIRSGRLLDRYLVEMYGSILAFGSADSRILNRYYNSSMGSRLLMEGYGKCPPICRIDPNGSNLLVADTAEVSNYATENNLDNSRPNLNGMTFHDQVPPGGTEATQVTIRFSISAYNRWEYDAANRSYLRYQDIQESSGPENEVMEAMVDKNNDQQITTDNVVVLYVPHRYAFGTKSGNNEIMDIQLEGSGRAYAFRDGLVYEAEWHRSDSDSILYLTLPDGSAYAFKPGNTWFEVIGETSEMSGPDGSAYRFNFSIP